MKTTITLSVLVALLWSQLASAQFSYNSREGRDTEKNQFSIKKEPTPTPITPAIEEVIRKSNFRLVQRDQGLTSAQRMDSFLLYTTGTYNQMLRELDKGKKIENITKKQDRKAIYYIHQYRNDEKVVQVTSFEESNFRTSKSISTQALAGLNLANNGLQDIEGMLELGARINNTRITLPTQIKFDLKESANKDTLYVTKTQKDRYLYLDFISRGVLATDSLRTTISEYINTTLGSPLSLRLNFQHTLTKPYLKEGFTGKREPVLFVHLDLDARAVPVFNSTSVEKIGFSGHVIPSLIAVFPSGNINSPKQEDNFIVQLTFNAALVTDDLRIAMTPDGSTNPFLGNFAFSGELRVGNYSETDPTRNWSVFVKYTPHNLVGQRLAVGFSFAPQIVKDTTTDETRSDT